MKTKKVQTSMSKVSPILYTLIDENLDVTLTITGNSMYPLLSHKRDSVVLTKCDKLNLKKGDITLYKRNNGQYILHRIVKLNKSTYNLCGDNQYIVERNLAKENIIAVVKAYERNGKLYSCNDFTYKVYWHLRVFTIPFRNLLHRACGAIRRIC